MWRNRYKIIAFNISSFTTLINSQKTLIIIVISNEKTNEMTTYIRLCRNVTKFYRQELISLVLFQVQEKLRRCRNSELSFWSNCFIANFIHIKIICLYTVVFNVKAILHFWNNFLFIKTFSKESTSKLLWLIQLLK